MPINVKQSKVVKISTTAHSKYLISENGVGERQKLIKMRFNLVNNLDDKIIFLKN